MDAARASGFMSYLHLNEEQLAQVKEVLIKRREPAVILGRHDPLPSRRSPRASWLPPMPGTGRSRSLKDQGVPVAYMVPKDVLTWVCGLVRGKGKGGV